MTLSAISARLALAFGALSALMAVAMGAMAAHALEARLDAQALGWLDTAVRYQMWHALALLGVAAFLARRQDSRLGLAALAWMVGTVLFSFSLYGLALTGFRPLAMITPVGGVAFLVGWGALAKAVNREDAKVSKRERIERGRAAFAKAVAEAEPKRFGIVADGDAIEEDFLIVEAVNLGMTGPRILMDPTAKPGDQLLDVVYLTAAGRQQMLGWLKNGDQSEVPPLHSRRARKVTLTWKEGPLRIDDEVFDPPDLANNIIVEIEPDGRVIATDHTRSLRRVNPQAAHQMCVWTRVLIKTRARRNVHNALNQFGLFETGHRAIAAFKLRTGKSIA